MVDGCAHGKRGVDEEFRSYAIDSAGEMISSATSVPASIAETYQFGRLPTPFQVFSLDGSLNFGGAFGFAFARAVRFAF
ncbi:hypothetical protein ASF45_27905 [Pseudorhodoferax sp. Leaf265]|nr:hypothetical protein ASF45_27905 [Pseudorhodoferax sp. Leaf265]